MNRINLIKVDLVTKDNKDADYEIILDKDFIELFNINVDLLKKDINRILKKHSK